MHEMFIVVVLAAGATLTVCALTIGAWRGMNSTTAVAVVMALAFLAGAGIALGGDATVFYIGCGAAFLVYFCFMLANIATTLKEIAVRLDGGK